MTLSQGAIIGIAVGVAFGAVFGAVISALLVYCLMSRRDTTNGTLYFSSLF